MQSLVLATDGILNIKRHSLTVGTAHMTLGLEGQDWLNPAGDIVGQQADRAGGCHRQQVAVANAMLRDGVLKVLGELQHKGAGAVFDLIKRREWSFLLGDFDGGSVRRVANGTHDIARQLQAGRRAVFQAH
jgi:hypothetical protein